MFIGHLAVALGVKKAAPRMPLGLLVGGTFGLDLLWPILMLAGVESVRIDPGNTAFTPLAFDSYPWSHSLLLAVFWSLVAGALVGLSWKSVMPGLLMGMTVVSHWLLDWVTHRPDLPLWPGGPEVGLGLWNSIPATILVEGGLFVAAVELYRRAYRPIDSIGRWAFRALIASTALIWISGPLSAPPPVPAAVAIAGLAMWLFPLWGRWIDRHRTART
jgi:membrane-bound metal-dependent hydrolase YbcI (DUF457 family)